MILDFSVTIAVASDLHCHAESSKMRKDSFLLAGARRSPAGKHPIQALVDLIRERKLVADALLCPGDLSNQICAAGMMQAWEHLREIEREMKCSRLLTTLGNHDVDSRKEHSSDSFEIPRNLHPDFPLPQGAEKDSFWARGFYFALDEKTGTDFVVLNTVISHNDEPSAKRGTFDHSRIEALKEALNHRKKEIYDIRPVPLKVAMLHHHPLLHSSVDYGSGDVLQFGDQILKLLGEFGFKLVIHGHRHDPRISRFNSAGVDQLIFAAGAFSAYLKELSSVTRNLFHIVTISSDKTGLPIKGRIQTWEFNFGSGWREATLQSASLPYEAGFTLPAIGTEFVESLCAVCDKSPGAQLRADEIASSFPQLQSLLPFELAQVGNLMVSRGYKLVLSPTGVVERCGRISTS